MKSLILILLCLAFVSCYDHKQNVQSNYIHAKKNNLEWSGITEIQLSKETDTLTIFGISNTPDDEVIVMKIKFEGPGEYHLTHNQAYYYRTIGGDVLISKYNIAPKTIGKIKILDYNEKDQVVEGYFQISLRKEWSNPTNDIEILDFENGFFSGKISH